MYTLFFLVLWPLVILAFLSHSVQAAIYVTNPQESTTCSGSKPCTVEWLDDGISPLLTNIGVCSVALYTAKQQAVQQLEPVDVSRSHSLTFTPDPLAGPNSNTYYIGFTPVNPLQGNGTASYVAFSPFFTIDEMQGSFASPLPAASSTLPIPASLTDPATPTSTLIVTVDPSPPATTVTGPTTTPTITTTSISTRFSTATATTFSATTSTTGSPPTNASAATVTSGKSNNTLRLDSLPCGGVSLFPIILVVVLYFS